MKKYTVLLALVIVVTAILTSCNKEDKIELDFDLTLPDNWVGYLYNDIDRVYDAHRIPLDEFDTLVEGLVIYKNHFPAFTLPLYFATIKQQIDASKAYDSLTYVKDTLINDMDFRKMVSHEFLRYINPDFQDTFHLGTVTERYFFYANDYGYNMTFIAIDSLYDAAKPSFDSIMHSFHYKN
jgi:hypothetical protein